MLDTIVKPIGRSKSVCRFVWTHFLLACCFFINGGVSIVEAHPISQGTLEIRISPDRINLDVIVSLEEVLISGVLDGQGQTISPAVMRKHADYLFSHLQLNADGHPLNGKILSVPQKISARLPYRFEYSLSGVMSKHLALRQDVLRELEFSPGNPWEASYIVRIISQGTTVAEGMLFTFREPLLFSTDVSDHLGKSMQYSAFVQHGIMHILTGYDHLLFVTALLLASVSWRDLIKVISAFTLAHSLTLALATLKIFSLSSAIVEPMIALSIVVVALQNLYNPQDMRDRERFLLAFGFGLFHGLGFAGGMLDAMGDMQIETAIFAILAFSFGIEIGHQIVVLPLFYGLTKLRRYYAGQSQYLLRIAYSMIFSLGLVYLFASLLI